MLLADSGDWADSADSADSAVQELVTSLAPKEGIEVPPVIGERGPSEREAVVERREVEDLKPEKEWRK